MSIRAGWCLTQIVPLSRCRQRVATIPCRRCAAIWPWRWPVFRRTAFRLANADCSGPVRRRFDCVRVRKLCAQPSVKWFDWRDRRRWKSTVHVLGRMILRLRLAEALVGQSLPSFAIVRRGSCALRLVFSSRVHRWRIRPGNALLCLAAMRAGKCNYIWFNELIITSLVYKILFHVHLEVTFSCAFLNAEFVNKRADFDLCLP